MSARSRGSLGWQSHLRATTAPSRHRLGSVERQIDNDLTAQIEGGRRQREIEDRQQAKTIAEVSSLRSAMANVKHRVDNQLAEHEAKLAELTAQEGGCENSGEFEYDEDEADD